MLEGANHLETPPTICNDIYYLDTGRNKAWFVQAYDSGKTKEYVDSEMRQCNRIFEEFSKSKSFGECTVYDLYYHKDFFDPQVTIGLAFASMGMREKTKYPYALLGIKTSPTLDTQYKLLMLNNGFSNSTLIAVWDYLGKGQGFGDSRYEKFPYNKDFVNECLERFLRSKRLNPDDPDFMSWIAQTVISKQV